MSLSFVLMASMKRLLAFLLACSVLESSEAADFTISAYDRTNNFTWNNVFSNAITTVEGAARVLGPWVPLQSIYDKGSIDHVTLPPATRTEFYRLLQVDISATAQGYTNFIESYGVITTIAGNGVGGTDGVDYWRSTMEGGFATNAALSRPHIAASDRAGNVYIADKDSHSILKVTPDGRIHTVAGAHGPGFNGDGPAAATNLLLNQPNGIHVRSSGLYYILDSANNKVRRVETNGIMTTLFTIPAAIKPGRGLWVKKDETLAYFCSGTELDKWTSTNGVTAVNTNFVDLGNLDLDSGNHVFVTDRGDNKVYRIGNSGGRTVVAGNGTKTGGGDGFTALQTGLWGVRGIWFLPNGAYLLATHEGSQVWYVDTAGTIRLLVDGLRLTHAGDGQWFHSPGLKVSEPRQITMTDDGDLLITENDLGYIRKISFSRLQP